MNEWKDGGRGGRDGRMKEDIEIQRDGGKEAFRDGGMEIRVTAPCLCPFPVPPLLLLALPDSVPWFSGCGIKENTEIQCVNRDTSRGKPTHPSRVIACLQGSFIQYLMYFLLYNFLTL